MRKDHLHLDGLQHLQKNLSQIKNSTVCITKPFTEYQVACHSYAF